MRDFDKPSDVDAVAASLAKSKRYRGVAPSTIRRMATKTLQSTKGDVPAAIKLTKRGLHEIYGAYQPGKAPNYAALSRRLTQAADSGDLERLHEELRHAMSVHASTRERLPYLETCYKEIFSKIPPPVSVRDLACGLNPLALPWMGLPQSVTYIASDIDELQRTFLDNTLTLLNVAHRVEVLDLIDTTNTSRSHTDTDRPRTHTDGPRQPGEKRSAAAWCDEYTDVTLLLKTVPCLERQRAGAGWELIDAVNSSFVVVSFPTKSLGRRSKGMYQTHSAAFEERAAKKGWDYERVEIPNELFYVVRKDSASS